MLLPINGRDFYRTRANTIGNFDYREAGEYAVQIGADVVVPLIMDAPNDLDERRP